MRRTAPRTPAAALSLFIALAPFCADAAGRGAGAAGAAFLKRGADARAAALGNAMGAAVDDATALAWNPAGLGGLRRGSAVLMHSSWLDSVHDDYAAVAVPLEGAGAVGLSVQTFGLGQLQSLDNSGSPAGQFSPRDTAVTLGAGNAFRGWRLGGTAKYVQSRIEDAASTVAMDLGLQKPMGPYVVGAGVQNLGVGLSFRSASTPLPLQLRLSGARRFSRVLLTADAGLPGREPAWAAAGLEVTFPLPGSSFAGRAGVNTASLDLRGFRALSAGLGWRVGPWSVDYAFVPLGELSVEHRVSLGVSFGRTAGATPAASGPVAASTGTAAPPDGLEKERESLEREREQLEAERGALALEWKKLEEARTRAASAAPEERRDIVAVVTSVQGGLQMRADRPDAPWEDIRPGRFLFLGDVLRTPTGSRAAITFVNGVESKIEENTTFKLGLDDGDEKAKQAIDLWIGEVFSKVEKGQRFIIKTPQGRARVKGTEFDVRVRKEATTVDVTDGVVEASSPKGRAEVAPGQRSVIAAGEAPTAPAPLPSDGTAPWRDRLSVSDAEKERSGELTGVIRGTTADQLLKDIGRTEGLSVEQSLPPGAVEEKRRAESNRRGLEEDLRAAEQARKAFEAQGSSAPAAGERAEAFARMAEEERRLQARKAGLDRVLDELDARLASGGGEIRITAFDKAIHFDVGRSVLPPDGERVLDKIAILLGFFPRATVEIDGHTDSLGDERRNAALSEDRARRVRDRLLLKAPGLSPERLLSRGFGETRPVASNARPAGRALNRRVEITLKNR